MKCERLRGIASFVIRLAFARLIAIREALRFVGKPLLFSKTYAVAIAIASDGKTLYTALAQHGFKSRMAFSSDYGGQPTRTCHAASAAITFHFSLFTVSPGSCHKSAMLGQSNSRSWSFLFIGILEGWEDQADPPRT